VYRLIQVSSILLYATKDGFLDPDSDPHPGNREDSPVGTHQCSSVRVWIDKAAGAFASYRVLYGPEIPVRSRFNDDIVGVHRHPHACTHQNVCWEELKTLLLH
jgi:hypothetical protein